MKNKNRFNFNELDFGFSTKEKEIKKYCSGELKFFPETNIFYYELDYLVQIVKNFLER